AAADCYLKAIDLDPDHVPTLRRLLDVYWAQGDDRGLLDVAADLDERGALLEPTTSPTTLARTMCVAALHGEADQAIRIAQAKVSGAADHLATTAAALATRARAPDLRALASALGGLVDRAGLDRGDLVAGLTKL